MIISKLSCTQKAMLLLFKCFDIKKVKSLKDSISIDRVLGGKPTKKKKRTVKYNILLLNTISPKNNFRCLVKYDCRLSS